MYLRSLRIHGFKSFAEPTEIELERGLTAIVGPNGCGKSNVVDAIRWALGEQSPTALRGAVMQDVIFNGGGRRGPLGMAEVTLCFDNKDRVLDLDRDTVRVTRRLFRDSGSEYLLNGQKCRLRDVRELLMDTGAGATASTFVEQGKIDALLHASPKERRQVLEEAAGIGKYKIRKQEAKSRLATVAQDRARLTDLLREVTDQHGQLKRQAQKAERYVGLRDELQAARLELYGWRRECFDGKLRAAHATIAESKERVEALGERLSTISARRAATTDEVCALERSIRTTELEHRDIAGEAKSLEERARQEGRRAAECEEDSRRLAYRREALEAKVERLAGEIAAAAEAREAHQDHDEGLGDRVQAEEATLAALETEAGTLEQAVEETRGRLMEALQAQARARNRKAELEARGELLAARATRLGRKLEESEVVCAQGETERDTLARTAGQAERRIADLDEALDAAAIRREDAISTIRDLEESYLGERRALDRLDARLAVLDQLDREGQGLEPGVRGLLALRAGETEAAGLEETAAAILGPIADHLEVEPDYATAIESCLGAAQQWVLVRTRDDAARLLTWLREERVGRTRLVGLDAYLERRDPSASGAPELSAEEESALESRGFLGWAAELASPDVEAEPVLWQLLEGACICDDLEGAFALCELPAVRLAITLEGEIVTRDGMLEGGAVCKGGGRIGRRSERASLAEERGEQESQIHEMQEELARAREVEHEVGRQLEGLRREHHEAKLEAFSKKRDLEERERVLCRVREEGRLARQELDEVSGARDRAIRETATLTEEIGARHAEATAAEAEAKQRAQTLKGVDERLQQARERLHALKVDLARGVEQWEALRRQAERAAKEQEEAQASIAQLVEEEARLSARSEAARQEKATLAERALRDRGRQEELETQLERLRVDRARGAEARDAAREEEDRVRRELQAVQGATQAAARAAEEATRQLEALAQRVAEELEQTLEQLPAPPPRAEGVPSFNERETEAHLTGLCRRLRAIGAVNLEALEACHALEKRKAELETQTEDLTRSEQNLRQTIQRLNERSRKLFTKTFEEVRGHFKDIFRKLFGGGRADLKLEAGECVLEAGVEIMAQPPGKKTARLSLLSGGEKVLATVALLFAVFRTKPGPFCLLDEIDAALDEHNVGRFVQMVRGFLDRSQIVVVTHSKKTMAAADALYGVTMPEPGVSRPVSVRLDGRTRSEGHAVASSTTARAVTRRPSRPPERPSASVPAT